MDRIDVETYRQLSGRKPHEPMRMSAKEAAVLLKNGKLIVVDAKGKLLPVAKLKIRLMQACYGITVHLVRREDGAGRILEVS